MKYPPIFIKMTIDRHEDGGLSVLTVDDTDFNIPVPTCLLPDQPEGMPLMLISDEAEFEKRRKAEQELRERLTGEKE